MLSQPRRVRSRRLPPEVADAELARLCQPFPMLLLGAGRRQPQEHRARRGPEKKGLDVSAEESD